jgi:CBS domain containing-hemolysin-like protein
MWGEKGLGISIVAMTVIVVIFCEIMPKIIAIKNAKQFALLASPFIHFFSQIVFPIRWILGRLTDVMFSFFEARFKRTESYITRDELRSVIKVGYSKGGILGKGEAEMMGDVLQLSDKKVEDVMVKRQDIVSFPVTMPIEEMRVAIKETELSRIPVYERNRANVLGVLYAKDLLKKELENTQGLDVRVLLRDPFYVRKDMRLSLLLREFRAKKIHLALVNGEKQKLVGLVTLEDLLEEIIGDIRDKETLVERIKKRLDLEPEQN